MHGYRVMRGHVRECMAHPNNACHLELLFLNIFTTMYKNLVFIIQKFAFLQMNNLFGHLNHECFKLSKPVGSLHESFDFPRVLHIAKFFN